MFGARKRGLIRQNLEIIRFFSLFYFYRDTNISLNQNKKFNFSVHSRKFKTRKIIFWPIRESLCSRNAKISRIFRLAKIYAPKVIPFSNLRSQFIKIPKIKFIPVSVFSCQQKTILILYSETKWKLIENSQQKKTTHFQILYLQRFLVETQYPNDKHSYLIMNLSNQI